MAYQVLARKWRPRRFAEMIGQGHVVQALNNALASDRLHHAYLFTGTRGVGKTTLARIFAKCLNCERGVTPEPCGECDPCREIDQGRFVDLLEVDAASRTKVDQTRDLLDNVPYAPVRGRFKVYLIDEVHMFSSSSFNALLKTLEEPPPHVKFLLATTDPQKVPVTVLSRCLQFSLKQLLPEQIQGQLLHILGQEAVPCEPAALALLARAADGSMRDGLSLLDQAIAFGAGAVREAEVRAMLGTLAQDLILGLGEALARGDARGLLDQVQVMAECTPDFTSVLRELLVLLHRLAVTQMIPDLLQQDPEPRFSALVSALSPEDVQLFYQIGLMGQQDLALAPEPRTGLEMVLLRMLAFQPTGLERATSAAQRASSGTRPGAPGPQMVPPGAGGASPTIQTRPSSLTRSAEDWHGLVNRLQLGGIAAQLASNCELIDQQPNLLRLRLDPACAHLRVAIAEERLVNALREQLGAELRVEIQVANPEAETPAQKDARQRAERQHQAELAMARDPVAQGLLEVFAAELVPGSVKSLDD